MLEVEIQQHRDALAEIEKILALAAKEKDLAVLREHLVDGEPCPLCGSVHHPGHSSISDQVMSVKQLWHQSSLKISGDKKEEKDSRGYVQGGLKAMRKLLCLKDDSSVSEDSSSSGKKTKKKKKKLAK